MSHTVESQAWYHTNKYTADAACAHCGAVVCHEDWCISSNRRVAYAYEVVLDAGKLTVADQLILHALGVSWSQNQGHACACGRKPQ